MTQAVADRAVDDLAGIAPDHADLLDLLAARLRVRPDELERAALADNRLQVVRRPVGMQSWDGAKTDSAGRVIYEPLPGSEPCSSWDTFVRLRPA